MQKQNSVGSNLYVAFSKSFCVVLPYKSTNALSEDSSTEFQNNIP